MLLLFSAAIAFVELLLVAMGQCRSGAEDGMEEFMMWSLSGLLHGSAFVVLFELADHPAAMPEMLAVSLLAALAAVVG